MSDFTENIELADNWALCTFSDISEGENAIVDGPFGSNLKTSDYIDEPLNGVPVLTTKNLEGDYSDKTVRFISKAKFEELKRSQVKPGDILVAKIGSIGKTGIYPKNARTAIIPANLLKFTVSKQVEFNYVYFYLNFLGLQNKIKAIATATAQPAFNVTKFRLLEVPLPPRIEQHRIVAKIEELFSSLDKGIESLKTAQQQLKVYRQAVLKWALEGRLKNENIEEGELPKGWKWVKLEEVVDEFVRGPFGGSLKKECFVPNGYKVYEQKNAIYQSTELGEYFINENKYRELIRFKVKPADFIVSCSGTIGKLFMIPKKSPQGIINQALLIIRINRDFLLDKFFIYLFTSSVFQRIIIKDAKGTAMLNLAGVKDMKLVPVLLPPIPEQHAIVTEIESRLSVCDKIEESIEHSLKQSEALRQSILKKAFEGKLVPQNPTDEPASGLLDRIKSEREMNKPETPRRRRAGKTKKAKS